MKVLPVIPLVLFAAASGFAYGHAGVTMSMTSVAADVRAAEPAVLLVFGSVLLGIAGAVRRYTV